jgi:hypothetical protein
MPEPMHFPKIDEIGPPALYTHRDLPSGWCLLTADIAVRIGDIRAVVEQLLIRYRDGERTVERYACHVYLADGRTPLVVDDTRLAELLRRLAASEHGSRGY